MKYYELDTPSLLLDQEVMEKNLKKMQSYADAHRVNLRPHTKTHKMPLLALRQRELGCQGITVAKVSEAEEMAKAGLDDIFIANEIVGLEKLRKVSRLSESLSISFGLDSIPQAEMAEACFAETGRIADIVIEIEVGENRSGIIEEKDFVELLVYLKTCSHIHLKGVFSHDGDSYSAASRKACRETSVSAQRRTLHFAQIARDNGFDISTVSIGSTPSLANGSEIIEGITEIRPGTYIFMDASQANAVGDKSCCAATVLATVMSKPTDKRVILDVGAKGLTMQTRTEGICAVSGLGTIFEYPEVSISQMYDEHGIIYNRQFHRQVHIGDKVRIIPVHICPVVNLYHTAYLIGADGDVIGKIPIDCQGKLQ